jgi:L-aminoadipate-semialdehyde dehydrogenase
VEEEAVEDEIPFDSLIAALVEASFPNLSNLSKLRFFNLIDTNDITLAAGASSSTSSDVTIFISQAPTARRLLPVEIRVVYNSVLFSEHRINEILEQIQGVLDAGTKVGVAIESRFRAVRQRLDLESKSANRRHQSGDCKGSQTQNLA